MLHTYIVCQNFRRLSPSAKAHFVQLEWH